MGSGWPDGHAAKRQSEFWTRKYASCLMVRWTKYAMACMTKDDRVQDEGQAPEGNRKALKTGSNTGSKQHKRWQLWPIVAGLALMAVCLRSTTTDLDEWRSPHPPTPKTPWDHDPVSLLKGEERMDGCMLQCYEDTPGQAQAIVINDEVRCSKWGSVATCPFETPAYLLMVAGGDDDKEPTPVVAVTADAAALTEEEAAAADVSTQAGDQGGPSTHSPCISTARCTSARVA
jgi:hypothetical protein